VSQLTKSTENLFIWDRWIGSKVKAGLILRHAQDGDLVEPQIKPLQTFWIVGIGFICLDCRGRIHPTRK
jgi:hypothetical protein